MTTPVILSKGTWVKINSAEDVLVTCTGMYEVKFTGNTVPTANDVGHPLNQPLRVPKGVGAYIRGVSTISVTAFLSSMSASTGAPVNPVG